METYRKVEYALALIIYLGSKWFVKILIYMFSAIAIHFIIKCSGLSLPPYF
jgi:hypothetical protein